MEDENGQKRLDVHLLACLAESRRTELHRSQVRDTCECVFYSVNRIVLLGRFDVSHHWQDMWRKREEEKRTWISS